MGRIVQEIPDIEEGIVGDTATGALLQVKQAGEFTTEFDGVASVNLCGHVLVGVSPLVESAADVRPKGVECYVTGHFKTIGGKSDRRLGVGGDFIPVPVCSIYADFVQEGGREGVVPSCRKGLVDLVVVDLLQILDLLAWMKGVVSSVC